MQTLTTADFLKLLKVAEAKLITEWVDCQISEWIKPTVEGMPKLQPGMEDHVIVVET